MLQVFLMFFLCRFNRECVTLWVKLGILKNAAGCSDNIALEVLVCHYVSVRTAILTQFSP